MQLIHTKLYISFDLNIIFLYMANMRNLPFIHEWIYDTNKEKVDTLSKVSQISPASISNYIKVRDELLMLYQKKCLNPHHKDYKECDLISKLLGLP